MKETLLRKQLLDVCEPFKHETDDVKRKMRPLYRVAMSFVEKIEKLEDELRTFKAPKLDYSLERTEAHPQPKKRFYSQIERIEWYLADPSRERAFELFLKTKNMTREEAIKKAKGEL